MEQAQDLSDCKRQEGEKMAKKLAEFYDGKNILITGCTGFIGKICLLKLLSSFNCGEVFVMLRGKKGMSPRQRFNKMLQEAPFNADLLAGNEELKTHFFRPEIKERVRQVDWSKVNVIEGDMSRQDLGLSDEVKEVLCKSVNIIFNIAASVQFDAPLKQNLRDNFLGAQNMLKLATEFKNLVSFVHVSTFYSNSHISHVEERVLPMNCDCEKMADMISWLPDSVLEQIEPQIMENRPNTYIFTKAMAENLVQKYEGRLPVAIVRPSIVVPSMSDPEPGWVDNVNGPMGLGVLASLGILRNIDWNYWGVSDFIPVDFVVNSMLAVAERTARLYPKEIKVYNCSTSSLNPTTWGRCFEVMRVESFLAPPYKMLRVPIAVPKHRRAGKIGFAMTKLSEILFAYLIDFILVLCGQKRLLTRLTAKLHHGYDLMRPFTTNEYTCSNDNIVQAYEELCPEDKKEFNFDIPAMDWTEGFKNAYYGARRRILKEDLSNVQAAVFKMRVLYVVEFVFKMLLIGLVVWTSLRLFTQPIAPTVSAARLQPSPLANGQPSLMSVALKLH